MTTLTFYNIERGRLFKLKQYTPDRSYCFNYTNYPAGSFYIVNEDNEMPELHTMFNKAISIGPARYLLTQDNGERHVLDIAVDGKVTLREIHEPTMDLVYGILGTIIFDDIDLDKVEAIIKRQGSEGLVHFFQMEVMKGMDKIPSTETDAKHE